MMMTIPHSLPGCRWGESVTILTSGCSWSGTNSFSVSVTTGPHGSGNCCCSLLVDQWNRLLRTRFISENSNSIAVAVYSEDLARTILSFNDLRMYVVSDIIKFTKTTPYLRPVFSQHERIRLAALATVSCHLKVALSIQNFSAQQNCCLASLRQPFQFTFDIHHAYNFRRRLFKANCFHTYEKSLLRMRKRSHFLSRGILSCLYEKLHLISPGVVNL